MRGEEHNYFNSDFHHNYVKLFTHFLTVEYVIRTFVDRTIQCKHPRKELNKIIKLRSYDLINNSADNFADEKLRLEIGCLYDLAKLLTNVSDTYIRFRLHCKFRQVNRKRVAAKTTKRSSRYLNQLPKYVYK